jgi:hypothetical protein
MDKSFYIIFSDSGDDEGMAKGFSNRQILADFIGIPYGTLTNHFVRDKKCYHYYADKDITVIKVNGLEKGRQKVKRKSKGHNRNI